MRTKTFTRRSLLAALCSLLLAGAAGTARAAQLMTRTLKEKPAIVVAAFGTSTKAQATYDVFEKQLRKALPGYEVRWAFTSEIIRERVNARWARQGLSKRLLSVPQVLANLQAEGYTAAVVEPLEIFPGEEYQEVIRLATNFPGIRTELGEALLQRWQDVHEVVSILSRDFLPASVGSNVVVAHGSPETAVGSNSTYLGLDRYISRHYSNVFLGCVEGIISREDALEPAKSYPGTRVRFIPLMFVGGDHVMHDVMGEGESPGEESWRGELMKVGKTVDIPMSTVEGRSLYRGMGLIPEVDEIFIRKIERALGRL